MQKELLVFLAYLNLKMLALLVQEMFSIIQGTLIMSTCLKDQNQIKLNIFFSFIQPKILLKLNNNHLTIRKFFFGLMIVYVIGLLIMKTKNPFFAEYVWNLQEVMTKASLYQE
jgi:hypothetical protein